MKFEANSEKEGSALTRCGWMIYEHTPEDLVGQLCQTIEMLGLRDSQEKATKDMVKKIIYATLCGQQATPIDSNLVSVIDTVLWKQRFHLEKHGGLPGPADYQLIMTIPDEPEL